jgi:hypothetical protein
LIATSRWEVWAAAPKHPYVKSIDCDVWRNHYVNCMVTTWNRHQQRYVTYSLSDKRVVYCFDLKLTDCVLRVWHPRLEEYRFYWDLSVNVTRISGGAIDSGSAYTTIEGLTRKGSVRGRSSRSGAGEHATGQKDRHN